MAQNQQQINLRVYGQEFNLRVAPEERELLQKAAKLVEERMKEIAASGIVSLHRIAMLSAIDIAFQALAHLPEMEKNKKTGETESVRQIKNKLSKLIERIDQVLEEKTSDKWRK